MQHKAAGSSGGLATSTGPAATQTEKCPDRDQPIGAKAKPLGDIMADTTTKPRKVRHIPRRSGVGMRQVYGPHPWRERLLKARQGTPSEFAKARYIPFLKGYGVASANAYNQRYVCPCGSGIVAPLDDPEFMTDVMDHEAQHAEVEA